MILRNIIAVGLGGAVGAMMRYGMTLLGSLLQWPGNMPTFLVNVLGSFLIGLLTACCEQGTWLLLLTVGMCGGFTTFSTFSAQSLTLIQQGKWSGAFLYIAGTVLVCILMAWLGSVIGQKIRM